MKPNHKQDAAVLLLEECGCSHKNKVLPKPDNNEEQGNKEEETKEVEKEEKTSEELPTDIYKALIAKIDKIIEALDK